MSSETSNILVTKGTYSAGEAIVYQGTTYYYGTTAFGTLQAAAEAVEAGGTVKVAAGTYNDMLNVDISVIDQKAMNFVGETDANGNNLVTLAGGVRVGFYEKPDQNEWNAAVHFSNFNVDATTTETQIRLAAAHEISFDNIVVEGTDGMNPLDIKECPAGAYNIQVSNSTFNHGTINIGRANEEHVFSNCEFNETKVNVAAGITENAVRFKDCTFTNTLTAESLGDNLYQLRNNGMGVNVIDSTFTFKAADASVFA